MKKNKLTLLSLIALLSVSSITLFSCSNEGTEDTATTENFSNDDTVVAKDDGIGQALPIGKRLAEDGEAETTPDVLRSDMGVLLMKNDTTDTYTIRYIAAFTGYDNLASATFTRDSYTNANGKIVAASSAKVSYIYTSVHQNLDIKWLSYPDVTYSYYMVYTIRNIPTTDIFTALSVSLNVTTISGDTLTASQSANVYGIQGDPTKYATYEEYPTVPGTYSAIRSSTDITEAVVAPYYASFDGFVATKYGDVIALNVRGGSGSNGAFESCKSLKSITLPDSIQYIGKYAFYSDNVLETINLPRDLTTIESSAFNSSCSALKTIHYEAKNLVTSSDVVKWNVDTIYVSKNVESLPNKFITSSNSVTRVVYEGTTAEWNALKNDSNKNNGLFIDNVMCSDSKIVTVNFHLNGSTLDGDTDTSDDLYITSIIGGHTVSNPGKPKKSGQLFKGWYSDAEFNTEYDFSTILDVDEGQETKTVDIYAKFEDYPAGSDISTAIDLVIGGDAVNVTLTHDVQTFYYKISVPSDGKKDLYYLNASNVKLNGEDTSKDFSFTIYESDKTTKRNYTYTYAPDKVSQYKVFGGSTDNKVLLLEPGETVYVAATVGYESTLSDENAEFSFDLSLSTKDNDFESDATAYNIGETLMSKADSKVQSVETMTFTATESKTYCARKIYTGYYYGTVMIYHYDSGTFVKDIELASSTVIGDLNVVAGTTYYIYCTTSNSEITNDKYMSVYIGDMPDNYKPSTATALPMDGTEETITISGFSKRYYVVTPSKDANYGLILNGGSGDYAKMIRVFKSDATSYTDSDVLISATETGTKTSSYGWGSTTYGGSVEATVALNAGVSYVVEVSFNSTSIPSSNNSFTFKAVEREAGDLRTIAYDLVVNEDGTFDDFEFDSKTTGKWFKYVATQEGYFSLYVDGLTDGNTATFQCFSNTSTTAQNSQTNSMAYYVTTSGSTVYYFYVETTAAQSGLTLKCGIPNEMALGDLSSLVIGSDVTARDVALTANCDTAILKFTSTSTSDLYSKFTFAPSAGNISFDWSFVSPSALATTVDSGTVTESSSAAFGTKKLEANKDYYLILKNIVLSDSTATLSVTPSVEEIPADGSSVKLALSLDSEGTYTLTNNQSYQDSSDYWFKFECTESGTYKFYSSSESTSAADPSLSAIYDGLDNATAASSKMSYSAGNASDHSGHSDNRWDYYVEVTLEAGHTYYFKMTPKAKAGKSVVVHVEKVEA